jgi:sec-independent protein translocase protein TatC
MSDEPEEMTIWDHLEEMRRRIFIAVIALVGTTLVSFALAQQLITILARPIGGLDKLQSIEVTENIGVFMKVSLLAGVILAMPVIVYELLMYILPGLTNSEKKWVFIAVPAASLLFLLGVIFTFLVMLPAAIPFLVNFLGVKSTPRLSNYVGFVTSLMFWIGISFETPMIIFILAKFRIVKPEMLAQQWRIAVVIIAVIAAAVTPTVDPINMSLLMAPLMALYGLSILLAYLAVRKQ